MSAAVAKRYARALFEVAQELNSIELIEDELKSILSVLENDKEFGVILSHPKISVHEKQDIMDKLFEGKWSVQTRNFVHLLIERRRETELSEIAKAFTTLANEARGYADATVTTAKPLSEEELNSIAARFGNVLKKTLRVQSVVDPAILGGVVVRIGDRLYDGSIAGKLARFEQNMKHAQVR